MEQQPCGRELIIRDKQLRWGARTYIMGVVNVTPDSFSGDGVADPDAAVRQALKMLGDGADIIDVGGESTRPGYKPVSASDELQRVIPVIRKLRARTDALISIDTLKPAVFNEARKAGADILNTVAVDPLPLIEAAAKASTPIVVTHNQVGTEYGGDVVGAVLRSLQRHALEARKAGLKDEQIIIDPGIGFGKTPEQNVEVLAALKQFAQLGFPMLIGTSRKSTLGALTGKPPDARQFATAASVALAIAAGVDVVRVHDVAAAKDVVAIADAMVRNWRPESWRR